MRVAPFVALLCNIQGDINSPEFSHFRCVPSTSRALARPHTRLSKSSAGDCQYLWIFL